MTTRRAVPALREGKCTGRVPLQQLKSTNVGPLQSKPHSVSTKLATGLTRNVKPTTTVTREPKFTIHEDADENTLEASTDDNKYSIIQQLEKKEKMGDAKPVRKALADKKPTFYVVEEDDDHSTLPSSSCYESPEAALDSEYLTAPERNEEEDPSCSPPAHMMHEMWLYMREREKGVCAKPRYMDKQNDLTEKMRTILIDWLNDVCMELSLHSETLHLAVSLIDRLLSINLIERSVVQLVGTAALLVSVREGMEEWRAVQIASKYEEIYPPEMKQLIFMTDDTYTDTQLLKMERRMLNALRFDVSAPTSHWFISHIGTHLRVEKEAMHMAYYLVDLSLLHYDLMRKRRSLVACAALCASGWIRKEKLEWSDDMVAFTSVPLSILGPIVVSLIHAYTQAPESEFRSMYDKYSGKEWSCVSTVVPPSTLPSFPSSSDHY